LIGIIQRLERSPDRKTEQAQRHNGEQPGPEWRVENGAERPLAARGFTPRAEGGEQGEAADDQVDGSACRIPEAGHALGQSARNHAQVLRPFRARLLLSTTTLKPEMFLSGVDRNKATGLNRVRGVRVRAMRQNEANKRNGIKTLTRESLMLNLALGTS
jgi:hypothetical protein